MSKATKFGMIKKKKKLLFFFLGIMVTDLEEILTMLFDLLITWSWELT